MSNQKVNIKPWIVLDQRSCDKIYSFHIYYVITNNSKYSIQFIYQPLSTSLSISAILKSHKFTVLDYFISIERDDTEQHLSFKVKNNPLQKKINIHIPSLSDNINFVFLDKVFNTEYVSLESDFKDNNILCFDFDWNQYSIFNNKQVVNYIKKNHNIIKTNNRLASFIKHITIISLIKHVFSNIILTLELPCLVNFGYCVTKTKINETIYNLEKICLDSLGFYKEQNFHFHNTQLYISSDLEKVLSNSTATYIFTNQNILAHTKDILDLTDDEYKTYFNHDKFKPDLIATALSENKNTKSKILISQK